MKTPRISEAFGNIPEEFVSEAMTYQRADGKKTYIKWMGIAACLCLIVLGSIFAGHFGSHKTPQNENKISSYFVITAEAANEESTQFNVGDNFRSSPPPEPGDGLFGGKPLFHFNVMPSDFKNNADVYDLFGISVSYGGTSVTLTTKKDEHIAIFFCYSDKGFIGYTVDGWFTEPTDIVITITDKESMAVVEEITVNVKYDTLQQEYELEITNLETQYPKQ